MNQQQFRAAPYDDTHPDRDEDVKGVKKGRPIRPARAEYSRLGLIDGAENRQILPQNQQQIAA